MSERLQCPWGRLSLVQRCLSQLSRCSMAQAMPGLGHDHAGVAARARRRGRSDLDLEQGVPIGEVPRSTGPAHLVGDGDGIDGLALRVELDDGLEDVAVLRAEEVAGDHPRLQGGGDGVLAQQHGPEQRLLGFEVVGHDASVLVAHSALRSP